MHHSLEANSGIGKHPEEGEHSQCPHPLVGHHSALYDTVAGEMNDLVQE